MQSRFLVLLACVPALSAVAQGDEVKTIYLSEAQIAALPIAVRGTVLSFPTKPSKVILGSAGSFGIEYVENDLAISPLRPDARSNLFVYLLGRRFSFDLKAASVGAYSIVLVRDAIETPARGIQNGKK